MYKNIICVFSFPFITQNVRVGRVKEIERERERERDKIKAGCVCTLTGVTVRFFCDTLYLSSSFSPGWNLTFHMYNYQMLMQIIVVTTPTYTLHVIKTPTQIKRHFRRGNTSVLFTLETRCTSCYFLFPVSDIRSYFKSISNTMAISLYQFSLLYLKIFLYNFPKYIWSSKMYLLLSFLCNLDGNIPTILRVVLLIYPVFKRMETLL